MSCDDPIRHARAVRARFFPQARPVAAIRRGEVLPPPPPEDAPPAAPEPEPLPEVVPLNPTVLEGLKDGQRWRVLLEHVAARHGVAVSDVLGRSRKAKHLAPRYELCWLAAHYTKLSYCEIARRLGRDHSTVWHAVEKMSAIFGVRAR